MREEHYLGLSATGFHRVAYTEWGAPANPRVLICAHGLTRNGRDFDDLASAVADYYRVVCPDVVGRGRSDWLANKADYAYPQYLSDMTALLARTKALSVDWVGTSMGGIFGMLLAAMPNSPIRRLVVNDVGSLVPKAALQRIGQYVGRTPVFEDEAALIAAVKANSPFGPLSESQWRHVAVHGAQQIEGGRWKLRYDPGIDQVFRTAIDVDADLGPVWNAIRCPVLVTRGEHSDLLLRETFDQMCARPNVRGVQFAGVGHAPMFMDAEQIGVVREFLLAP